MDYDFSVLSDAQITHTEFAKLLGVSRMAAINWINGTDPSPFLRRPVKLVLDEIRAAVERGDLPGQLEGTHPSSRTVETRLEYIRSVINLPY